MNRLMILGVAVLAGGWLATASFAQPPREGRGPQGPNPERRQQLLVEFDADGDGQLSEEERAHAREVMRDRRQGEGRGALEGRRQGQGRGALEGRRRPDGPPEGRPRRERAAEGRRGPESPNAQRERPAGPPDRISRLQGPRPGGPNRMPAFIDPRELFDQFDENKDDQLSREEFLSLSIEVAKLRADRMAQFAPPAGQGSDRPFARGGQARMRMWMGRPDFRGPGGPESREGRGRPERREGRNRPDRPALEDATDAATEAAPAAEQPI